MGHGSKLMKTLAVGEGVYITSRANIFYYSGFTSEDARLVLTSERKILITDSRYLIQANNQAPDFEIADIKDGLDTIFKDLGLQALGYEEDDLTCAAFEKLKSFHIPLQPMQKKISAPRRIKDSAEIAKIRRAEELGDAAFSYILSVLRAGMTEQAAALELEYFMRKNGAQRLSFETIVASGVRSAMPHGVAGEKVIEKGDFVTLDFGCVLDGYCSDMTRTVVVGQADERQKEIYAVVKAAQTAALGGIVCGMPCRDVDEIARKIIRNAGYGEQFGHSLGHSVGIEIHESPNFSPKSPDVVENGHVITVEPGIYVEGFGGVRIEDVVAVWDNQVLNLTASPKELITI